MADSGTNYDEQDAANKMPNRDVMKPESYYAYCCAWCAVDGNVPARYCDVEMEHALKNGVVFC